jgi:O-antigen ligase
VENHVAETLRKWWLPGWVFALYFIYTIPNTIALRNLLLVICLLGCVWMIKSDGTGKTAWQALKSFRTSGWILAALSCWLLVQSSFISPYPHEALNHLRGDWFNELLIAATGGCAVLAVRQGGARRMLTALTLALFAHAALLLAYQCWLWLSSGNSPLGLTPFANRDYHSAVLTALIALLLADLSTRVVFGTNSLAISQRTLVLILTLSYVAIWVLMARNAVAISCVMTLIAAGIFIRKGRRGLGLQKIFGIVALLLALSVVTWIGQRSDERWSGFGEAVQAALDTKNNLAWLDEGRYARPARQDGQAVDHSTYMRLAWAKVALEQIERYPLGLGYGHKAFGWAVNRSYGLQTGHESSHSGLLDFTLANGIPGLILWLALSGALIAAGWKGFSKNESTIGLLLAFTVIAYLVRCLFDGHLSGFRLEMYALLVGVLVMTQALEQKQCK